VKSYTPTDTKNVECETKTGFASLSTFASDGRSIFSRRDGSTRLGDGGPDGWRSPASVEGTSRKDKARQRGRGEDILARWMSVTFAKPPAMFRVGRPWASHLGEAQSAQGGRRPMMARSFATPRLQNQKPVITPLASSHGGCAHRTSRILLVARAMSVKSIPASVSFHTCVARRFIYVHRGVPCGRSNAPSNTSGEEAGTDRAGTLQCARVDLVRRDE
jgi:hypothetical protein